MTGRVPPALRRLATLWELRLADNGLTGSIPAWLGDVANLRRLDLANNGLTGRIPAWLGDLTDLVILDLGGNELTGRIPSALRELPYLYLLGVRDNRLDGPVPAWLGDLTGLLVPDAQPQRLHRTASAEAHAAHPAPAVLDPRHGGLRPGKRAVQDVGGDDLGLPRELLSVAARRRSLAKAPTSNTLANRLERPDADGQSASGHVSLGDPARSTST